MIDQGTEVDMKRGFAVLLSVGALMALAYFTASKWAIHHRTLTFLDMLREDRTVTVDLAIPRDREMEAMAEMIELPVAILSHGNTVKFTEYSFLANLYSSIPT
jgi:predicted dienelactone hydrolase